MTSDLHREIIEALRKEAREKDDRATKMNPSRGPQPYGVAELRVRAARLRSLAARLKQEPDEADVERVARAILMVKYPSYDASSWEEDWRWYLRGRHNPQSCVHYSNFGIVDRQARAAIAAMRKDG